MCPRERAEEGSWTQGPGRRAPVPGGGPVVAWTWWAWQRRERRGSRNSRSPANSRSRGVSVGGQGERVLELQGQAACLQGPVASQVLRPRTRPGGQTQKDEGRPWRVGALGGDAGGRAPPRPINAEPGQEGVPGALRAQVGPGSLGLSSPTRTHIHTHTGNTCAAGTQYTAHTCAHCSTCAHTKHAHAHTAHCPAGARQSQAERVGARTEV